MYPSYKKIYIAMFTLLAIFAAITSGGYIVQGETLVPRIGVEKVIPAYSHEGKVLNYSVTVRNIGNCALYKVNITDPHFGVIVDPITLNVSSSQTFIRNYTIQKPSGDISGLISVAGYDGEGKKVVNSTEWAVDVLHPGLQVTKTSDKRLVHIGDAISYSIKVKNIGDCQLEAINVTEGLISHLWKIGPLMVGEEKAINATYMVEGYSPDPINGTTTAWGMDPSGYVVEGKDFVEVDILHPRIGLKVTGPRYAHEGDLIEYSIEASNLGDCIIQGMNITESNGKTISGNLTLGVGESCKLTKSVTIPRNVENNTFTVSVKGFDVLGLEVDNTTVGFVDVIHPGLRLAVNIPASAHEGDYFRASITVENTGDCDLSKLSLRDDLRGYVAVDFVLAVGKSRVFDLDYDVPKPSNDLANTAVVEGLDPSNLRITSSNSYSVDILHPRIGIEKGGSPSAVQGGEAMYKFYLVNLGDCKLTGINVTDVELGSIMSGKLDVKESKIVWKNSKIWGTGKSNVTARGLDDLGLTVKNSTTIVLPLKPASFRLSEVIVNPVTIKPGEKVTVDFMVYNEGDLPGWKLCKVLVDKNEMERRNITLVGMSSTLVRAEFPYSSVGGHLVQVENKEAVFTVLSDQPSQGGGGTNEGSMTMIYILGGLGALGLGAVLVSVFAGAMMTTKSPRKRRR